MTINEAITQLRALKQTKIDDNVLIGWLSDLDGMIYNEVICSHVPDKDADGNDVIPPHGPYDAETDPDTALLVGSPYSDLYVKYLAAQCEHTNGDFGRYTNSMILYNMRLQGFSDWYNRSHMPKQSNCIRI